MKVVVFTSPEKRRAVIKDLVIDVGIPMHLRLEVSPENKRGEQKRGIREEWGDRPRSCGQRFHPAIAETEEHASKQDRKKEGEKTA